MKRFLNLPTCSYCNVRIRVQIYAQARILTPSSRNGIFGTLSYRITSQDISPSQIFSSILVLWLSAIARSVTISPSLAKIFHMGPYHDRLIVNNIQDQR